MEFNIDFTAPHLLSGLSANTPILLALSGGADSRALLDMLIKYCKEQRSELSVAHVNHMIRGIDAERDRDFCAALAKKYSLPFYLLEANVPSLAKEHGRGLEEEARIVRYEFFAKIMRENSIPLLATAHNATDNAETVLFNLARGSGLKGLCGIPPTRDFEGGKIIRPLLKASKDEILEYCRQNGLEYVTDATNTDVAYSRNRIRGNIIPELCLINDNAIANISRMSEFARSDNEFLDSMAREFISSLKDKCVIPTDIFSALDTSLKSRVAGILLGEFFEVNSAHVESFIELAQRSVPHSAAHFPNGVTATVENKSICLSDTAPQKISVNFDKQIFLGETKLEESGMTILVSETENTQNSEEKHTFLQNIYKKSTTTLISFDKINDGLFIRPKQDGDKILSGGVHKKLKKLFCEKKIPLDLRAKLPVFYDRNGIFWVPLVAKRDEPRTEENKLRITLFYN